MEPKILSKRHRRIRAPKDCEKGLPYTEEIIDGKRINICEKLSTDMFIKSNKLSIQINSNLIHSKFLRNNLIAWLAPKFINVPDRYEEVSDITLDQLSVDNLILGGGIGGISALESCTSCLMITDSIEDEFFYDPTADAKVLENIKNIIKQKSDKIVHGRFIGKYDEGLVFKIDKKYYIINYNTLILANGSRYIPPVFPNNDLPGIISRRLYLKYNSHFNEAIVIGSTDLAIRTALVKHSLVLLKTGTRNFSKIWLEKAKDNGIEIVEVDHIEVKRNGKRLKVNYDGIEKEVDIIVFSIVRQPRIEPIANLGYEYSFYPSLHIYLPKHSIDGLLPDNTKIVGGARGLDSENLSYLSGKIIYEKDIDEFIDQIKNSPLYNFYRNTVDSGLPSPYFFGNGYICECEDVTSKDVIDKINNRYTTVEGLKRVTGVCTGSCQGKICSYLVGSLTKSNNLITFRSPLYSLW